MRRRIPGERLLEAFGFLTALAFAAGAIFLGGPRAGTWAVLAAAMAALVVLPRLLTRTPRSRALPHIPLIALLENARPVPLVRSQLRVDKQAVYDAVAELREQGCDGALLEAAEAVEDAVYRAMPMPLTDEVRLPRERVAELVRALRTAGA